MIFCCSKYYIFLSCPNHHIRTLIIDINTSAQLPTKRSVKCAKLCAPVGINFAPSQYGLRTERHNPQKWDPSRIRSVTHYRLLLLPSLLKPLSLRGIWQSLLPRTISHAAALRHPTRRFFRFLQFLWGKKSHQEAISSDSMEQQGRVLPFPGDDYYTYADATTLPGLGKHWFEYFPSPSTVAQIGKHFWKQKNIKTGSDGVWVWGWLGSILRSLLWKEGAEQTDLVVCGKEGVWENFHRSVLDTKYSNTHQALAAAVFKSRRIYSYPEEKDT